MKILPAYQSGQGPNQLLLSLSVRARKMADSLERLFLYVPGTKCSGAMIEGNIQDYKYGQQSQGTNSFHYSMKPA
jgi:hypothetical protein